MNLKYWAALTDNGDILETGVTNPQVNSRFDRRCFAFSCGGFGAWMNGGAKYCELDVDDADRIEHNKLGVPVPGQNIKQFKHKRIRRSKDVPWSGKLA